MRNQSYTRELEQMNQQIQEQDRKKQENLTRIQQERENRNTLFKRESKKQEQLQEQIINQEKKVQEEVLNHDKLASKGKITSGSQEKINCLNRELFEKKRELDEQIRQSQTRENAFQRQMEAYVEQLLNNY
jgi:hypothetical protein